MDIEISEIQAKRLAKVARLAEYFHIDNARMYEWLASDERIDFALLSDSEVAAYLEGGKTRASLYQT